LLFRVRKIDLLEDFMSIFDEEKAWAQVPDAVTLVIDRQGRVYHEKERRDDLYPTFYDDVALTPAGEPCIIFEPVGGANGGYREHPIYNAQGVAAWQDAQFAPIYKNIRLHKWDSYYAKKAGLTVKEWLAQKAAGVKNPAPTQVIQEVMPTPEQCQWQWEQDLITEHGLNKWHRGMYRCICRQRSCVHFRNGR
jgi:hypothetical protein